MGTDATGVTGLHLFEAHGVEIEYMIVAREGLDVLPVADEVLLAAGGEPIDDVDRGTITWSNEIVLHVIELKTSRPETRLEGLAGSFLESIREIQGFLAPLGGRLLPGGSHPWMDPFRETRLWPHDCSPVYGAFDRIFDCRGHGWSNLQAAHLNLPFDGEDEFVRLHAAIRMVLPLLPALAASSPFRDGAYTGFLDGRVDTYARNCERVPSVAGLLVPEPVGSTAEYRERILGRIYSDLAPLDPEGTLRHEWVNARGAIARFDRSAIEIRLIDAQECPASDLAIARLVTAAVEALAEERWCGLDAIRNWPTEPLHALLRAAVRDGEMTVLDDPGYLRCFGLPRRSGGTAGDVWSHLARELVPPEGELGVTIHRILQDGPLARRLLRACGTSPSRETLLRVYGELADCLAAGELFRGST